MSSIKNGLLLYQAPYFLCGTSSLLGVFCNMDFPRSAISKYNLTGERGSISPFEE